MPLKAMEPGNLVSSSEHVSACRRGWLRSWIVLASSCAALFSGGIIYVAWRPRTLLMFRWFEHVGLANVANAVRSDLSAYRGSCPEWCVYSLPEALWVYSGTCLLCLVWGPHHTFASGVWLSALPCVAIAGEVGQALHFLPGTPSFCDASLSLIAALLAIAAYRILKGTR